MIIAIQPDRVSYPNGRMQSYSDHWVRLAREAGHAVEVIDIFGHDVVERLRGTQALMWRFLVSAHEWAVARRVLEVAESRLGLLVYPDRSTRLFHNDKILQSYLLRSIGIPTPETWVFWHETSALEFCRSAAYPLVLKLSGGVQANNVRLLRSPAEAESWVRKLFSEGVYSLQRRGGRIRELTRRSRHASNLLLRGKYPNLGRRSELHRNYVLLQEFMPGNEYDTRVTIIGNRAFAFRRRNRKNDFRASGSGAIDYDHSKIDMEFVKLGFRIARALGCQTVAVDGLYGPNGVVACEIDIAYADWAVYDCPGHWELKDVPANGEDVLVWNEDRMWPQDAIWEDFSAALSRVEPMIPSSTPS